MTTGFSHRAKDKSSPPSPRGKGELSRTNQVAVLHRMILVQKLSVTSIYGTYTEYNISRTKYREIYVSYRFR